MPADTPPTGASPAASASEPPPEQISTALQGGPSDQAALYARMQKDSRRPAWFFPFVTIVVVAIIAVGFLVSRSHGPPGAITTALNPTPSRPVAPAANVTPAPAAPTAGLAALNASQAATVDQEPGTSAQAVPPALAPANDVSAAPTRRTAAIRPRPQPAGPPPEALTSSPSYYDLHPPAQPVPAAPAASPATSNAGDAPVQPPASTAPGATGAAGSGPQ